MFFDWFKFYSSFNWKLIESLISTMSIFSVRHQNNLFFLWQFSCPWMVLETKPTHYPTNLLYLISMVLFTKMDLPNSISSIPGNSAKCFLWRMVNGQVVSVNVCHCSDNFVRFPTPKTLAIWWIEFVSQYIGLQLAL